MSGADRDPPGRADARVGDASDTCEWNEGRAGPGVRSARTRQARSPDTHRLPRGARGDGSDDSFAPMRLRVIG